MKIKLKTIIKIFITITLVFLLLYKINIQNLFQIIKNIHPLNHVLILSIFTITNIIHSYRWKLLLKPFGYNNKLLKLFKLKLISIYYNSILPSNLSGDFIRSYYLSKDKDIELSKSLSSVILERFLGFGALMLLIFIGIFFNYSILTKINIFPYLLIIFILFVMVIILLFNKNAKEKLQKFFSKNKYRENKIVKLIKKYYLTIHYYAKYKKTLWISFLIAIILQSITILINYLAFHSIGIEINIWKLLFIIPIISILNMIPASFGNIGFSEGIYVLLFSYLGIEPEQSITISLLIRFYTLLLGLIGAFFATTLLKTKSNSNLVE
jgi:glycosyltransferase 2 family protein